jgi:hypothetical protein
MLRRFCRICHAQSPADVWKILRLTFHARTIDDQIRLAAVMRSLGWDRRLLRFRAGEVRRGFVRGADPRTVCQVLKPAPSRQP